MVYVIKDKGTGYLKIGYSKDPGRRLKDLEVGSPLGLELRLVIMTEDDGEQLENELHNVFYAFQVRPSSEWFSCSETMIWNYLRINASEIGKVLTASQYKDKCAKEPGVFRDTQLYTTEVIGDAWNWYKYLSKEEKDVYDIFVDMMEDKDIGMISYDMVSDRTGIPKSKVRSMFHNYNWVVKLYKYNESRKKSYNNR